MKKQVLFLLLLLCGVVELSLSAGRISWGQLQENKRKSGRERRRKRKPYQRITAEERTRYPDFDYRADDENEDETGGEHNGIGFLLPDSERSQVREVPRPLSLLFTEAELIEYYNQNFRDFYPDLLDNGYEGDTEDNSDSE